MCCADDQSQILHLPQVNVPLAACWYQMFVLCADVWHGSFVVGYVTCYHKQFGPCDIRHDLLFPDVPVLIPSTAVALTIRSSLLDAHFSAMRFRSLSLVLMLDVPDALPFRACDSGDNFPGKNALMLGMAGALPGRAGPSMHSFGQCYPYRMLCWRCWASWNESQ